MKPIILTVIEPGNDFTTTRLVVEDTGTGLDIRRVSQAKVEADNEAAVDIGTNHCEKCRVYSTLEEEMDLSPRQVYVLKHWRNRKELGIESAELAEALDKVVGQLRGREIRCGSEYERILLRVEFEHG